VHGVTSFTYDGDGTRAKKSGPNGTTYYYGALFEKQGSELVKYVFAGDQRVAMVKSGAVKYFHQDHLGSASVVTDGITGLKIPGEEAEYLPFGGQRGSSAITVTNYGFTDQEKDPETGLYNYNARFYDPVIGVFVSADTMVPNPGSSQGFNRYAYCHNNPLIYTDPSGNFEVFDPIGSWFAEKSGVDSISVGLFAVVGGEVGVSFNENSNMIDITNVGVGVGIGFSVGVNTEYGNVSYGVAAYAAVGYHFEGGGWYVAASGTYAGVSASGSYYFSSGYYNVGIGYGYDGVGVNVSYSNYGGWSAGASVFGVGANYNFESGRWLASVNAKAVAEFAKEAYYQYRAFQIARKNLKELMDFYISNGPKVVGYIDEDFNVHIREGLACGGCHGYFQDPLAANYSKNVTVLAIGGATDGILSNAKTIMYILKKTLLGGGVGAYLGEMPETWRVRPGVLNTKK
jgi:RHS repeat-associated protein